MPNLCKWLNDNLVFIEQWLLASPGSAAAAQPAGGVAPSSSGARLSDAAAASRALHALCGSILVECLRRIRSSLGL